jgi:hypothetical protein
LEIARASMPHVNNNFLGKIIFTIENLLEIARASMPAVIDFKRDLL